MKKLYIPLVALALISCEKEGRCDKEEETGDTKLEASFKMQVPDLNNIFENQPIIFENTSTAYSRCVWEFGDATKATTPAASHSYPMHGYYTVKLTVWNQKGERATATKDIPVLCNVTGGSH
jgi:PKD domain